MPVQGVISAAAELFPLLPAAVVQAALEGLGSRGALRPGWAVDWGRLHHPREDHSRVASLQFLLARVVAPPQGQPPVERVGRRGRAPDEAGVVVVLDAIVVLVIVLIEAVVRNIIIGIEDACGGSPPPS